MFSLVKLWLLLCYVNMYNIYRYLNKTNPDGTETYTETYIVILFEEKHKTI